MLTCKGVFVPEFRAIENAYKVTGDIVEGGG